MFIPVNEPIISNETKINVLQALDTGWLSSSGAYVEQFEKNFATFLAIDHAITVSSGTAALHVALLSLGIGVGDEVIVPAFTMGASWLAVLYTGAKPVFVDCELDTYNIDVTKIEEKISFKTKAIMMVHIYGHPCEIDTILLLCKKYNLFSIEDAAEAHGAMYKGKLVGTFANISCFSFYANKIITTGEGGMIVTNSSYLNEKCRKLKDLHHSEKRFIHNGIGYNYRLTNLQAAVGCGELTHIEEYVQKKIHTASRYEELLSCIPGLILPKTKKYVRNVFWMYGVLTYEKELKMGKDELRAKLMEKGIDTRDFFYSPSDQPILKEICGQENFPNTNYIAMCGFYLPSGLALTDDQMDYVVETVKSIVL